MDLGGVLTQYPGPTEQFWMQGALPGLQQLVAKYDEVHVVSRVNSAVGARKWTQSVDERGLFRDTGLSKENLHFVHSSKEEILKKLGINVYVDDRMEHLQEAGPHVHTIHFCSSCGARPRTKFVWPVTVSTWDQLLAAVDSAAQQLQQAI